MQNLTGIGVFTNIVELLAHTLVEKYFVMGPVQSLPEDRIHTVTRLSMFRSRFDHRTPQNHLGYHLLEIPSPNEDEDLIAL